MNEENQKLQKIIDGKLEQYNVYMENYNTIKQEIAHICFASFKGRFPDIQVITPKIFPIQNKDTPYIKHMQFQRIDQGLKVFVTYFTTKKNIKPKFNLYLFSQPGTNIHRETIQFKGKLFAKSLKPNREIQEIYTVKIFGNVIPWSFIVRIE
jgi:hypothetical protein